MERTFERHGHGLARTAALVGDPARANMLAALLDGRALTATELAFAAGVSPATASGHLAKLVEGRLLGLARQGRHRYFRLAGPEVGRLLESLLVVADAPPPRRAGPRLGPDLRAARTCYDHLAGRLGVALADALAERGAVRLGEDGGAVTPSGAALLAGFGIDGRAPGRRPYCRPCLDWSERRPHLAGALGAALCTRCLDLGWIARVPDSRAVQVTETGQLGFFETFGVRA
ncbi:helix-turn-helix transcriptional regulator [Methylobacterium sp. NEAU 140]|uniref:ArsR/SmtB family transcription factor n=1 Tax=Methylobacterium sp. NEAU 140 TaxID=3064945 RepID=UPI0027358A09|nr:helix-turn-helix transcriptional regulator [Methylobacterium sp. NEAU 140]MDP4022833.1 helix-turn-helix transcriptional regulator [Methylobacterium sp. NEAU 140]